MTRKLQWVVFVAALAWPPLHAIASRKIGFSSWRYFGWGMYATPHPEELCEVSVRFDSESEPHYLDGSDELSLFLHVRDEKKLISLLARLSPGFRSARVTITRQRLLISTGLAKTEDEIFDVTPQKVSRIPANHA